MTAPDEPTSRQTAPDAPTWRFHAWFDESFCEGTIDDAHVDVDDLILLQDEYNQTRQEEARRDAQSHASSLVFAPLPRQHPWTA